MIRVKLFFSQQKKELGIHGLEFSSRGFPLVKGARGIGECRVIGRLNPPEPPLEKGEFVPCQIVFFETKRGIGYSWIGVRQPGIPPC